MAEQPPEQTSAVPPGLEDDAPSSGRAQLVWDVIFFQFKLAADGLKDILLSPLSLAAMLIGLIAGGRRPDRYFRQLLIAGRRIEHWVNLFGYRHGDTSDKLVAPYREKVFNEMENTPWLRQASDEVNQALDSVNDSIETQRRKTEEDNPGA